MPVVKPERFLERPDHCTSDAGILTSPYASTVPIAVFVADAAASSAGRAAIIAKISSVAIAHYR